jgi:hypothetical protein
MNNYTELIVEIFNEKHMVKKNFNKLSVTVQKKKLTQYYYPSA